MLLLKFNLALSSINFYSFIHKETIELFKCRLIFFYWNNRCNLMVTWVVFRQFFKKSKKKAQ